LPAGAGDGLGSAARIAEGGARAATMTQAIAATPIRRHKRAMNRNERVVWSISR
jgi:hypothetical protein